MMLHEHDCANACRAVVLGQSHPRARMMHELHDDGAVLKAMCSAHLLLHILCVALTRLMLHILCLTRSARSFRKCRALGIDLKCNYPRRPRLPPTRRALHAAAGGHPNPALAAARAPRSGARGATRAVHRGAA